jgi:hypothetical protein
MERMEGKKDTSVAYEEMEKASMLMRGYILELLIKETEMEEKKEEEGTPAAHWGRRKRQCL